MKYLLESRFSSSDEDSSSDEEVNELASALSESIAKHITVKRQQKSANVDNSIFVLDKTPGNVPLKSPENDNKEKSSGKTNIKKSKKKTKKNYDGLSSYIHCNIDIMDPSTYKPKQGEHKKQKNKGKETKTDNVVQELMKKSVITPDFEKQDSLEPYEEGRRKQKLKRKKEKAMTKGKGWFDMKAPEMTDEAKMNLEMLKMRKALDPKRFYKNNDMKGLPKFFQFGKVVESAADFYHSRVPKKKRKANLVQELLADAEFRQYNKRKYVEIQEAKKKGDGPYKRMRRLKKKKKIN